MSNLINWSEVSRLLTNGKSRSQITQEYKGKMYIGGVELAKIHEKALEEGLKECVKGIDLKKNRTI